MRDTYNWSETSRMTTASSVAFEQKVWRIVANIYFQEHFRLPCKERLLACPQRTNKFSSQQRIDTSKRIKPVVQVSS